MTEPSLQRYAANWIETLKSGNADLSRRVVLEALSVGGSYMEPERRDDGGEDLEDSGFEKEQPDRDYRRDQTEEESE
jgi:hypothetical protein